MRICVCVEAHVFAHTHVYTHVRKCIPNTRAYTAVNTTRTRFVSLRAPIRKRTSLHAAMALTGCVCVCVFFFCIMYVCACMRMCACVCVMRTLACLFTRMHVYFHVRECMRKRALPFMGRYLFPSSPSLHNHLTLHTHINACICMCVRVLACV
jgi:hypothetical protein